MQVLFGDLWPQVIGGSESRSSSCRASRIVDFRSDKKKGFFFPIVLFFFLLEIEEVEVLSLGQRNRTEESVR